MTRMFLALIALGVVLPAQNALIGGGEKAWIVAPMVGVGSHSDPKRPSFVREAGVPFRYEVSDDGTMALVEASPRNIVEMKKLADRLKTDARTKFFTPGKDKLEDVLVEFRKWKRDYDPLRLRRPGLGAAAAPLPAPAPAK